MTGHLPGPQGSQAPRLARVHLQPLPARGAGTYLLQAGARAGKDWPKVTKPAAGASLSQRPQGKPLSHCPQKAPCLQLLGRLGKAASAEQTSES